MEKLKGELILLSAFLLAIPRLIIAIRDSDSFSKREKANEDFYVREKEREKYACVTTRMTNL